jgi:hypothetical protein
VSLPCGAAFGRLYDITNEEQAEDEGEERYGSEERYEEYGRRECEEKRVGDQ